MCANCSIRRMPTPECGDRLERGGEALHDDGREPERELVDEDHARVGDERLREHHHLLLAARERGGR